MRREAGKTLIMLIVALLTASIHALSQADDVIEFEHLTLEDGLSNLRVEAIMQDYMGYIWIGSKRGLCRYNGYDFEVFKSNAYDSTSLSYHQIKSLYEDRDHDLWIGTWSGGLNLYDREHNNFRRMPFAHGDVTDISQDSEGYLWFGTNSGLYKYDKQNDKATAYHFWSMDGTFDREILNIIQAAEETYVNISGLGILKYHRELDDFSSFLLLDECKMQGIKKISHMFVYNSQTFWMGTDQGLFRFSPVQDDKLQRILDEDQKGIYHQIRFIINESYSNIWIGADGLYKYDIIKNTITHYKHDINNVNSLSNDFVTYGYLDVQGNIWIGTYASGINILMNSMVNFHKNSHINQQLDLLSRNITAITQDKEKNLWLGTWDKGVFVFNKHHQQIDDITSDFPALQSLSKENVRVLSMGPDENIWIGSSSGLLTVIDMHNQRNEIFPLPVPDDEIDMSLSVNCLLFESDTLLWIGTSEKGLFLFDLRRKKYISFSDQPKVNTLNILDIERDRNGNLWIATYQNGVFRMDDHRSIRHYEFEEIQDERMRDVNFITIYRDVRDNLWFGTEFHGLIKLSPDNKTSVFFVAGDLKNNEISSIQEDHFGRLWLATTEGLIRFEESTGTAQYYYWRDGLAADEFNYNASFQGEDNTIYLGGTNGFAYFSPGLFRDNLYVPPVYIESLFIGNQKVRINHPDSPLSRPINLTEKITLKYSQNVIGFEFVALNYLSSEKNQYAYMLEGFDESGWNELGTRRRMTFTNLDYGGYTLRVRGSNNDGVWNEEEAILAIRILPPFWLNWWALVIYGMLLIVAVYLIYSSIRQRIIMKQQITMQHLDKEQQLALSNMKLQFFTNISHEFKIPLSLIISPLEEIVRNFKGSNETRQKLQMIQRNAARLLRLIKILIDFRKAEQDVLDLETGRHDLISLVRDTVQSFQMFVIKDNKHIELRTSLSSCVFEFDRNKMERVLYNLIANAVSFTKELSQIVVTISECQEEEAICIEVHDTGIGINAMDIDHIFEKFYQTDRSSQKSFSITGSGIGLYLVRKIVELHQGKIHVDSSPGKGSTFTITLPAVDMHGTAGDVSITNTTREMSGLGILEALEENDPPQISEDAPLILIVEDHIEMRIYLRQMLWNYYRIEEADNGISGLEKAMLKLPDLILSDIMMPEMDGVQMCMQIKRNPKTEQIPVILLSAKSDLDSKVKGYEKGADEYLEKPFSPQHLLARIRNLIESREKLRNHYSDGVPQKDKIAGINPVDREFLEKVFYKIEQNIGNSEYNVTKLSLELYMSRVHLYRRFKDLTGYTPKDYMKQTRLKAAALLLEKNRFTVSEVAYQVGFNTPSNFTVSFKSYYGISPKEYKTS